MKKTMIFLMLFLLSITMFKSSSYANYENLPVGRNYFDLSMMFRSIGVDDAYQTQEAFKVKTNTTYTFVMSEAFLKYLYEDIETKVMEITNIPGYEVREYSYIKDVSNHRVYVEFYNTAEYLNIDIIHMPTNYISPNYEIVLYEGEYQDFFGFEPYLSLDDQIEHYGRLLINYDQLLTTETISSYINATNYNDESISLNITGDTYSTSDKLPGIYEMIYEANYNQIKKAFFLTIEVQDLTAPIITIDEPIEVSLVDKVDLNTIKSYISVSDNVDDLDYQDLIITQDSYSAADEIGTYQMTVEASDSSGNLTTHTFDIDLIDVVGPVIKGTDEIYLYVTDDTLTHAEILSYYNITDDIALNESSIGITSDQYLQQTTPGVYQITISATDNASNTTIKDVYIHVIDNRGPQFNINEAYIITVTPEEIKSESDIISWLSLKLKDEGIVAKNLSIDHNEYSLRSSTKGQYYVYLNYEVEDEVYQTRILMDVVDENGFEFKTIYLLSLIPIAAIGALIIYRKKK
ncbi:hypothetical protein [Mariniplasma anaerobium]|uniref:Uncharacterized protein n=1 Tax=Mariniplasma anaerobium TaxID=2735436 RepID=A0A7U9XVJ3_9MOLU|nr:hypothetical protein [Mariniplasma anaerobium]BCR36592.1 hypothetical protein MPAN_014850 [Mariniplasma anaerobium]